MNKTNSKRNKLIFANFNNSHTNLSESLTFAEMIEKVLTIPSYYEKECCTNIVNNFPVVFLDNEILHDDLSNIEQAIVKNIADSPICARCKMNPQFNGKFGNHIFVEVNKQSVYFCRIF